MPSTWPATMWPPKRPPAAMARSRFTRLPGRRSARAERFRVSCITSAVKPAGGEGGGGEAHPVDSDAVADVQVLQHHLGLNGQHGAEWAPRRMAFTVPISSTIPVNIYPVTSLSKQNVLPQTGEGRGRRGRGPGPGGESPGPPPGTWPPGPPGAWEPDRPGPCCTSPACTSRPVELARLPRARTLSTPIFPSRVHQGGQVHVAVGPLGQGENLDTPASR